MLWMKKTIGETRHDGNGSPDFPLLDGNHDIYREIIRKRPPSKDQTTSTYLG